MPQLSRRPLREEGVELSQRPFREGRGGVEEVESPDLREIENAFLVTFQQHLSYS